VTLRTTNGPPNGFALLMIGFTRTNWRGNPLPFSMATFGAPGCSILAGPDSTQTQSLNFAGIGNTSITVPDNPAFVGVHIYSQSAPLVPGANALGLLFSNGLDTRIGGWQ
jgi:hypothetical protein